MALFSSTSEVRTFENQVPKTRRKGVLKIKTFRMDPQEDPAFPIPTWQKTLETIKDYAMVRIEELKNNYNEDNESFAKILVCEKRVQDTKCWRKYYGKEKSYLNFHVHFATSATPHPEHSLHLL